MTEIARVELFKEEGSRRWMTGENAIETMKTHVERVLDDPQIRVFQILGYFGIGKRTALRDVFECRGIKPVEHDYTVLDTGQPIIDKIMEHPTAVHLWDDVFRSIVLHPQVLPALQQIQDGTIKFDGTFLLVANDQEFPDGDFPPFPGVHIDFEDNAVFLNHLERQMRLKGQPEQMIRRRLRNVDQWKKEGERRYTDE